MTIIERLMICKERILGTLNGQNKQKEEYMMTIPKNSRTIEIDKTKNGTIP